MENLREFEGKPLKSAERADLKLEESSKTETEEQLSNEQADMLLCKLVLILANEVGDRGMLREALALARSNTLGT